MKIISPHTTPAILVDSYKQIADDAQLMQIMVNSTFSIGRWREALALSHAQVSEKPYRFFVLHHKVKFGDDDIIINPVILNKADKAIFFEACMSYPFRGEKKMNRYLDVTLEYQVKGLFGLKTKVVNLRGIQAIIVQHEIDHAHGKCIY